MLAAELVALVVPPRCAACRAPGRRAADVLCGACRRTLPWLTERACCPRCALPLPHLARRCPAHDAPFDAAWSAMAYEGIARDAMHALKFSAARPLAEVMAAQIAANAPAELLPAGPAGARRAGAARRAGVGGGAEGGGGAEAAGGAGVGCGAEAAGGAEVPRGAEASRRDRAAGRARRADLLVASERRGRWVDLLVTPAEIPDLALVAVPAHPLRRRTRGFDPADLISRALARRTGIALLETLRRSAAPSRQLGASGDERRASGRLAYEARGPAPRTAILVDDVHTTGATLSACAHALKAAGADRVIAITWARTL